MFAWSGAWAHAELMKKDPDAEHDETWGVHVLPGHRETLVWQFTLPGESSTCVNRIDLQPIALALGIGRARG